MSSKEVNAKPNDRNFFMAFQAAAGAVKCEELLLVDDPEVKENVNQSSVNNSIRKVPSKRNLISEF